MGDIPYLGYVAGLTRLYWLAVQCIRAADLADDGNALILAQIVA